MLLMPTVESTCTTFLSGPAPIRDSVRLNEIEILASESLSRCVTLYTPLMPSGFCCCTVRSNKSRNDVRVESNNWSTRHHYRRKIENIFISSLSLDSFNPWKFNFTIICGRNKSSPTNCHLVLWRLSFYTSPFFCCNFFIIIKRLSLVALSPPLRHIKLFCNEKSALKFNNFCVGWCFKWKQVELISDRFRWKLSSLFTNCFFEKLNNFNFRHFAVGNSIARNFLIPEQQRESND